MQGTQVRSLVGEVRSHRLCGTAKKRKKMKKKIKERGFKELYKWKVLQTEEGGERKILAKRDCFGQGYLPLGERWDLSNRFPH